MASKCFNYYGTANRRHRSIEQAVVVAMAMNEYYLISPGSVCVSVCAAESSRHTHRLPVVEVVARLLYGLAWPVARP